MFGSPQLWPARPFLALTRIRPGSNLTEFGVLYDARGASSLFGYSATVFRANVFHLPPTEAEFLKLPHYTYDTFEEIADDGWVVD